MSEKVYKGSGGLWYNQSVSKASDPRPRWRGSYTCECGRKNNIEGYGADQGKQSQSPNAPTIRLRRAKQ